MPINEAPLSRVTRSKEEARISYDRLSRWYDILAGGSEKRLAETGLHMLAARPGEQILEIGFGTGHAILALAQAVGDSGRVYGLDISAGMLHVTHDRAGRAGLSGRIDLRCGDAARLPFEPDSFDAVFTSFTLELFDTPEIPAVLQECTRVLRRGGRVCVVAMSREGKAGLMVRLYDWAHKKLPRYVDCRPIYVDRALRDAGLTIVDVTHTSTWGLPVEIVLSTKA